MELYIFICRMCVSVGGKNVGRNNSLKKISNSPFASFLTDAHTRETGTNADVNM